MTTLTPEDRAYWRATAEHWPDQAWSAGTIVRLLDALDAAEAAVQRVREMHVPQPHVPGQCDPDGCPDLCQECGERMPCTTRRIICERTTLGAGDWEADPAQVARYYSDKRSQRVQRALDGDA